MQPAKVVELDDKEVAVRHSAASADLRLSMEDHHPLVCRAGPSRLGSVHTFSVTEGKPFSSVLRFGYYSNKATGHSFDEKLECTAESVAGIEDITEVTSTALGGLQPKAKTAF